MASETSAHSPAALVLNHPGKQNASAVGECGGGSWLSPSRQEADTGRGHSRTNTVDADPPARPQLPPAYADVSPWMNSASELSLTKAKLPPRLTTTLQTSAVTVAGIYNMYVTISPTCHNTHII